MEHRNRKARRPRWRWKWWALGGAVVALPLVLWAAYSTLSDEESKSSLVGKTLRLSKPGVAVTKAALESLLTNRRAQQFLGSDQLLRSPAGTRVKVTYAEMFQNQTLFQVLIENGRYKGRSGWITDQQIDWQRSGQYRKLDLSPDAYEIPIGMDGGDLPPGFDFGGIPDGGIPPDK